MGQLLCTHLLGYLFCQLLDQLGVPWSHNRPRGWSWNRGWRGWLSLWKDRRGWCRVQKQSYTSMHPLHAGEGSQQHQGVT